jgi:hypothetical protein
MNNEKEFLAEEAELKSRGRFVRKLWN